MTLLAATMPNDGEIRRLPAGRERNRARFERGAAVMVEQVEVAPR